LIISRLGEVFSADIGEPMFVDQSLENVSRRGVLEAGRQRAGRWCNDYGRRPIAA
jgi:hypothetical protein